MLKNISLWNLTFNYCLNIHCEGTNLYNCQSNFLDNKSETCVMEKNILVSCHREKLRNTMLESRI